MPHRLFLAGIALWAIACTPAFSRGCPPAGALERDAIVRTFHHPNGAVFATGRGLPPAWDREFQPWNFDEKRDVPATRVGRWTYWDDSGAKRAEVTYALSCYIQCCSGGPCPQMHDRPAGAFTLWYPSGRKLGEGTFAVRRHVDTSCQGGDDTFAGRIADGSRFWREDGSPMTLDEVRAAGLLLKGW